MNNARSNSSTSSPCTLEAQSHMNLVATQAAEKKLLLQTYDRYHPMTADARRGCAPV